MIFTPLRGKFPPRYCLQHAPGFHTQCDEEFLAEILHHSSCGLWRCNCADLLPDQRELAVLLGHVVTMYSKLVWSLHSLLAVTAPSLASATFFLVLGTAKMRILMAVFRLVSNL